MCAWLVLGCLAALAQQDAGGLVVSVRDPNAAVVPAAQVAVTNVDTGQMTEGVTNEAGDFTASPLRPGRYRATVKREGFQTAISEVVSVGAQQIPRVPEPGGGKRQRVGYRHQAEFYNLTNSSSFVFDLGTSSPNGLRMPNRTPQQNQKTPFGALLADRGGRVLQFSLRVDFRFHGLRRVKKLSALSPCFKTRTRRSAP